MTIDVEQVLRRAACALPNPWLSAEKAAVFEWLLEANLTRMVGFSYALLRRCGGNLEDAKDAVADTLLDLNKYLCTYDPSKSETARVGEWGKRAFRTWAYAALRHKCVKHCRTLLGLPDAADDWEREDGQLSKPAALTKDYEELLGFLPLRERLAIEMIVTWGRSHPEAAAAAGCSEQAMRVRYFTAVHRLEGVHAWLETLSPRKARLLRLFVGVRLAPAEAARRVGISEPEAAVLFAEACVEIGSLEFARGYLLHPEIRGRLCA